MMWFHTTAAMRIMKKRKGPLLRMMLVAFVGSLWCIAGSAWFIASWRSIDAQFDQVNVDVFLQTETSDSAASEFSRTLNSVPGIGTSSIHSGSSVWKSMATEIGVDSSLQSVVELPFLVRATVDKDYASYEQLSIVAQAIEHQNPSVVSEVVWPKQLIMWLDAWRRDLLLLGIATGVVSVIMFAYALTYAFRAEIHSAGSDLYVGSILGASSSFIAAPHLIVSLVAGSVGLVGAFGLSLLVLKMSAESIRWLSLVKWQDLALIASAVVVPGSLICWWQSVSAARKAGQRGFR